MAKHNVFVSYRYEDEARIDELKDMLKGAGADVRDSGINSSNPNDAHNEEYIKSLLRDRIDWAGKVVVIVSPETKNHEWVNWEIEYAADQGKRIVGVYVPGAQDCDVPEALEIYANAIVTWDATKVVAALEGEDNWEFPDGTPAPPRQVRKAPC
jgi:hypothetical protein